MKLEAWVLMIEREKIVICGGKAYTIGPEQDAKTTSGFGGRKFTVLFKKSGNRVTTTNLWWAWGMGELPTGIEDNAEIYQGATVQKGKRCFWTPTAPSGFSTFGPKP